MEELKRNVIIPIEEYRQLVRQSVIGEQIADRVDCFAQYVNEQVKNGYGMADSEICGAILGFEVIKNKPKAREEHE